MNTKQLTMMTEQEHNDEQCTMNNVQWRKVKLGDCLKQKPDYGINAPAVPYDNNLPTYLRITDITEDGCYSKKDIVSVANQAALKYVLEEGDLVFARTGASVGKTYLYDSKDGMLVFAGFLIRVKTDENVLLPEFFKYQTHTPQYKNWIAANSMRTGQPGINGNEYEEFTFSIPFKNGKPDLAEQRRIAAILASADKVIAATQKTIAKYKQIKQGMMEDLLNEQCTMNNVQWKKVRLGEVCEPSSEKYNPLTENTFQYCIEMENINQESGTINGKSDITKLLSLKTKFHKGEVLYGKLRPYLKKYWLADFDGACSTEIWVLKNSENIDNQFLFYLFQSDCINRIANQSSGTKMPRADWKFMEKQTVSIPFKNDKPDLTEQRRIAAILSGIDAKIAAEEKVLEKYEKVKKGLMERLLNEQ